MTVSTTINSMLLTYGPLLVTYYGYNLKSYNAYHACFFGALAFLLTQIAKFIILAILFPLVFPSQDFVEETSGDARATFVVEHDILKAVVSVVDLIGLYLLFNAKRLISVMGDIEFKILSVGLGWASAELLTCNFLDIIFQGWSNEMKVEYITQALAANLDIVELVTMAALAYALTRKDDGSRKRLIIYLLVLLRYLFPVALKYMKET